MCIEENILEYKRQELLCVLYMFFLFINFVKNTSKLNSFYCFKCTRKEQRREEKKRKTWSWLNIYTFLLILVDILFSVICISLFYFTFLLYQKKIWLKVIDSFTERKKKDFSFVLNKRRRILITRARVTKLIEIPEGPINIKRGPV